MELNEEALFENNQGKQKGLLYSFLFVLVVWLSRQKKLAIIYLCKLPFNFKKASAVIKQIQQLFAWNLYKYKHIVKLNSVKSF